MTRLVGLLCLLAMSATGCIRFHGPGEGAPSSSADPPSPGEAEPAAPSFAAEQAKLSKAREHLEAQEWDEAERLALEVRKMLRERDDRPKKAYPTCKKLEGSRCTVTDWDLNHWFDWIYGSTAILGLARANARDELAGLTALDREGIEPARCPSALRQLCEDMEANAAKEDYSALFEKVQREPAGGGARRKKTGQIASNYYYVSIPGMAGYSAESVGYFLQEHVVGHLRKERRRYGAVWMGDHFEAKRTERQQGGRTVYAWKGTTQKIGGTSCRDVGDKLRIGRTTFDVQRCRKSSHISQAATVTMSLSSEEAAQIDFAQGDAALVIFETAKVGGSKLRLNLGSVRLARVAHTGESLQ